MTQIAVGVVGVGALGWHHARLYSETENANLVGVYDLHEETAKKVAEKLGVRVFKTMEAMAAEVDAVSIAVPTNNHFEIGRKWLNWGKHILVEKPITETVEEASELIQLADHNQLVLQVGHVERFNPVISYLEEKATQPRFIECHRLASYPPPRPGLPPRGTEVGVVLDLMIHDIDLVLALVKSPVTHVDAVGIPVLSPTEDIANARIRFANGCVANLTASRVTPEPMRKIRVFQSDTYISLDYQAKTGEIFQKTDKGLVREDVPIHDHNALLKELEHFVDCVVAAKTQEKVPRPKVSGECGLRALEIAVAIRSQIPELGLYR